LLTQTRTRRQPGTVELGYWLIERARGRRRASRAVALLARWALTNAGLARVQAHVEPDNVASQRVLESVGFRREGHLRSYLVFDARRADALIYSLLPSDLA
jgi:RimJ/RimL family protein N-acetyltransferase